MELENNKFYLQKKHYKKESYKQNIIYVNLAGRIGNVMFQLAAAATIAKINNCVLIAIPMRYKVSEPDNCLLFEYLQQFKRTILRNFDVRLWPPSLYSTVIMESNFHFSPIKYWPMMLIKGYFQSEKYFESDYVNNLFKIDEVTLEKIKKNYNNVPDFTEMTSINIRRGDYLKLKDYFPICSIDYYKNAIDIIGRDKFYFITSDDLKWCKKVFVGKNFFFADKTNPTNDLYLQTLCRNNIISNSTFSWWGAWLNRHPKQIVVAPNKWFGLKYSSYNTKDLIPKEWIKI